MVLLILGLLGLLFDDYTLPHEGRDAFGSTCSSRFSSAVGVHDGSKKTAFADYAWRAIQHAVQISLVQGRRMIIYLERMTTRRDGCLRKHASTKSPIFSCCPKRFEEVLLHITYGERLKMLFQDPSCKAVD